MESYRPPTERELEDVENILVSVAKRLDEGMLPPDQVGIHPAINTVLGSPCHVAGDPVLPDK